MLTVFTVELVKPSYL